MKHGPTHIPVYETFSRVKKRYSNDEGSGNERNHLNLVSTLKVDNRPDNYGTIKLIVKNLQSSGVSLPDLSRKTFQIEGADQI